MTTVGQKIKIARELLGLSQTELGEKAGVRYQQIYLIENGKSEGKLCTIIKILKALNIQIQIP